MSQSIAEEATGRTEDGAEATVDRWAVIAVALEPAVAGTAVSITPVGSWKGQSTQGATSLTESEAAVNESSNNAIYAAVWNAGGSAPTGVTWNGTALTLVTEAPIDGWTLSTWILVGPDTGTFDLIASFASSVAAIMQGGEIKDIHQTTPTAGIISDSATGEEASISITVTSGTLTVPPTGSLLVSLASGFTAALRRNIIDEITSEDQSIISSVVFGGIDMSMLTGRQDITTKAPDTTGPGPIPPKFDEPPAGDPGSGIGEPGVGEARVPRREPVGRRGLRGRRGFKAGPPGHRGLPPVQGEQIDKRIPDEYEEPLVRKWLTFGWLAIPMLEGQKTITLRDWGPTEGVQWQHGELFYAYDTPPVEGGRRLAILRVMQEPFVEFTAKLRMADYHKLGYSYAMANQLMSPSGRTALQVWEDLHNNPESLWLLRFAVERIFEQGRKERDVVQIAERPPQ